jgi:hypothetical protein
MSFLKSLFLVLSIFIMSGYGLAGATPSGDLQSILDGTAYYNPSSSNSTSSCGSGTITLSGNDNIQETFNYFVSQGLTAIQSAGIVGNLLLESEGTMNPEIVEGGSTQADPSNLTTDVQGYGIAQWTPGDKIISLAQEYNITTPVNQLATQLQILWDYISSGGSSSIVAGLKALSTTTDTTTYFQDNLEKPNSLTASINERINYANGVLKKYGGLSVGGGSANVPGGCQSSVDCTTNGTKITGNAEIACDVLKYDPISYSEAMHSSGSVFHQNCPVIGPSCATDCSGLVNLALYDVFGNDGNWTTYTMVSEANSLSTTKNFEIIQFNQLAPGDFMQPNPGHVVIIESVSGDTLNTFAANNNSPGTSQADQVSPGPYPVASTNVYLRYIGQGSTYGH